MTAPTDPRAIRAARALVATPHSCADAPALRDWAWHVLRGRPLPDDDPTLSDRLARTEPARLARIRAHATRLGADNDGDAA